MRPAAPHELVKDAVIRVPAAPGLYWSRPFGLEVTCREPRSRETGAIVLHGWVLAQDGTTTRSRRVTRTVVVTPGQGPGVTVIRKAPPPEFTAVLATFLRQVPEGQERTMADMSNRWGVVGADGVPLPGRGTGPAIRQVRVRTDGADAVQTWTLAGDWDGKPTPWLAKEYFEQTPEEQRLHRDPIEQCIDRVRQERGILRLGENLTYDLSVWHHSSAQELRDTGKGTKAWRDTYVCRRCQQPLKWLGRSPWTATLDDDEECHGETWTP